MVAYLRPSLISDAKKSNPLSARNFQSDRGLMINPRRSISRRRQLLYLHLGHRLHGSGYTTGPLNTATEQGVKLTTTQTGYGVMRDDPVCRIGNTDDFRVNTFRQNSIAGQKAKPGARLQPPPNASWKAQSFKKLKLGSVTASISTSRS